MNSKRLFSKIARACLGGLVFAAIVNGTLAEAADRKPLNPMVKLKVGAISVLSDAGLLIGIERGYFKQEGLSIEIIGFKSGPQIIPPLATGEVQVSGLSVSPAFFNAVQRNIAMRIVADKGQVFKGAGWAAIVIRKDIAGKIKDFKDLKGLKIAVPAKGVSTFTQLGAALKLGGLTPKDVDIVQLSFPNMIAALANKAVDAAMLIEPFVALASVKKVGVRWKGVDEFYSHKGQNGVVVYSEKFAKEQPEAAKRWMIAYLRGVRDYIDSQKPGGDKEAVINILAKYTPVKNRKLYKRMAPIGFNPNGRVDANSVKADQDWFLKLGIQKKAVDLKIAIDNQYVDHAVSILGKR